MKLNLNNLLCAASILAITPSYAQTPAAEVKTEKKALIVSEKSLIGYWAPDEESLRTQLLEQVKPLIAAGQVTAERIEQQAKKMATGMTVNYATDGISTMHTPAGPKKATYKVTALRPEEAQLDVTIISPDAGEEKGTLTFKAEDKYILTQVSDTPGPKMNIEFNKLTAEVAEARIKASATPAPATKEAPKK